MSAEIKLTTEQLNQIIQLAKDNENIDIELLVRAMGIIGEKSLSKEQYQVDSEQTVDKEVNLKRKWDDAEDNKLLHLYKNTDLKMKEIGEQLRRSESAVMSRVNVLRRKGVHNKYRRRRGAAIGREWTEDEEFFLEEELVEFGEPKRVPAKNIKLLSRLLKRTEGAITTRLYTLSE